MGFFTTNYYKYPCDIIGGAVKRHVAKQRLQMSLNSQTLDYKAMIALFENEILSIEFFGICKESMISINNLEIEKWYEGEDTVSVTKSSHHIVPWSSSRTVYKLTSKDEPYVDILDFNVAIFFEIGDISSSTYVACIYNLLWRIGLVSLVDIAAVDVINIDFMHPHGPRKTFNWHKCGDSCYVPVKNIITIHSSN